MNAHTVLDLLFPPACVGCRKRGVALCERCRPRAAERCAFVRGGLRIAAAGPYEGAWRHAILRYKRGRRDALPWFGGVLAETLSHASFASDARLIGVPTSPARARERGFDQGPLLARAAAAAAGREALAGLEQVAGDAQRGRSRGARLRALRRFRCTVPQLVYELPVVLVDDVVTTGATLADCAATLRAQGARVGGALVLAYA